ncbi:disabled homolog 2-interacting protein-like, partial [Penaeus japonicus]|uniref:disabled homolog 2-interacting protein-like n=1 Tax=Penaeus japonicus TaxID=27405 RepID=UPI001C714974
YPAHQHLYECHSRQRVNAPISPSAHLPRLTRPSLPGAGVVTGVPQQRHAERGSSSPSSPSIGASRSAESTPIKIVHLISKKLKKGGRSASKLEHSLKNADGPLESADDTLRSARSHESLQSAAYPHDHETTPSPLHERSRITVNRDEVRRTENTLKIWVMEAKGIPNKKKYFCNLILNNELYRRTFSKMKSNMCFWGEYFELNSLPQVSTICIELMREADKKPGYKKIGTVEIDLKPSSPGRAALVEQWYPVKVDKPDREIPTLRIKHRFQSLDILPLSHYGAFRQYLKDNATSLCQLLEPVVSVKSKEDIATTLINIMQKEERAITFLVSLILSDIQRIGDKKTENEHLLFRGNSVATKAIEAYMRLVGEHYLQETLSDSIQTVIATSEDLEVDPLRITNIQYLPRQRDVLRERVCSIWDKIIQSGRSFPVELRKVFHTIRERLSRQDKCELTDNLISACVFLRFLCPAVLSPSLFNITQEYPDERAGRNLTLVAKTLQTLANFTHFQGKESFMEFLNEFIDKEQEKCRTFLRTISSPPNRDETELEFDGEIDLGKHLAQLHLHLTEAIAKIDTQGYESEASKVLALVEDINILLGSDQKDLSSAASRQLSSHAQISTPPLVPSSSSLSSATHPNNNYIREGCGEGLNVVDAQLGRVMAGGEVDVGMSVPTTNTPRSQSLPRAATPIYTHHQMQASISPSINSPYRDKTAANDLSTSDDYVLITAFDHQTEPQNFMYPSIEANNNNSPLADMRLSNNNTYYMAEVAPPSSPMRQTSSPGPHAAGGMHQPLRGHVHHRLHPRATAMSSRSHSLTGVPNAIERRVVYQDECSELYRYMDSCSHKIHALCMDSENNIQGSQTSISQLSNVASSGYQSFAYSQSSSPVDSLLHTDNSSLLSRENGNSGPPGGLRQVLHGSPVASPMHQPHSAKHRAVAVHPAYLGHAGHVSLHGTPRHIPRVPQPKGSPNSSLSSSQSVEDLSSLRRGRTRQRRSASSSSDSSPDTRPASHSHSHSRRPHAHPPRTNPHCSPRLATSQALRHELRARSRYDRSASGRRGKNLRSCERDDYPRGSSHCYDDSEDEMSIVTRASTGGGVGMGVGSWAKDGRRLSQDEHIVPSTIASQQILDQQEDQMRAIVERLMTMEQEFRHEQELMRREMHDKDARIDAQAKKIAALDTANTELIRTIATLSTRPSDMKATDHELPGDTTIDSCNASDTSDYKSSSC